MATYIKICKNCKSQFKTFGSKTVYCSKCNEIEVECFICGKKFVTSRLIYERTLKEKRKFLCSRKCSSIYAGRFSCKNLYEEYCDKCGEITKHNPDGSCKKCISLQNLQSESMQKWIKSEECNEIRRSNRQKWNNSEYGKKFHSKIISDFNKSKEGQENIKRNLNKIHNLMSQGFGANSEENLRKRILNTNFGGCLNFKFDDKTLYYDYSINDYIPWNEYKEKFKIKIEASNNFIDDIKLIYPNAFIQTTFRTQESDNWAGARQAFEFNLIEKNINWFSYIKFFIDEVGNIKPLVVGKTGSLNVNANGSDVSFSTDINDGPARRFLNDEKNKGFEWCKTQILIIPCENENEAYNVEKFIFDNFNLFQS